MGAQLTGQLATAQAVKQVGLGSGGFPSSRSRGRGSDRWPVGPEEKLLTKSLTDLLGRYLGFEFQVFQLICF